MSRIDKLLLIEVLIQVLDKTDPERVMCTRLYTS